MHGRRLLLQAFTLFAFVYTVSLLVLPGLPLLRGLSKIPWLGPGAATQAGFLFFSLFFILILGKGRFSDFGFRGARWQDLLEAAAAGLSLSAILFVGGLFLTWLFLAPAGDFGSFEQDWIGLLQQVLSVWIVASACEEILYRGLLQGRLAPLQSMGITLFRWRLSVPVLFGALAFGLGHLCLLGLLPWSLVIRIVVTAFVLGCMAGCYLERTKSLLPAMVVHASFNVSGTLIPLFLSTAA